MRKHWNLLFPLNFIHTGLTFLKSTFMRSSLGSPLSVWKQKFRGNRTGLHSRRCSYPSVCKRRNLSQVKLLSGSADVGSFFFCTNHFPSFHSPSGLPFAHFLHNFAYWCACALSLYQLYWKFTQLQKLAYAYIFTRLYCFGVDSRVVFLVRVKFSWPCACCCSTWGGKWQFKPELWKGWLVGNARPSWHICPQ